MIRTKTILDYKTLRKEFIAKQRELDKRYANKGIKAKKQ